RARTGCRPISFSATNVRNSASPSAPRAISVRKELPPFPSFHDVMDSVPVDLLLRTATFALAMSAAVMIATRNVAPRTRNAAAPLLAFAIGGIGAFAVSSAPMAVRWFGPVALAFDAWCIATPAALWILAQTLFREDFRPGPLHWALAGAL